MSSRTSDAAVDRRRLLALIAALAVVSTGAAAAFAAAQTGYAVEIDGAVDVPHTTYEAEGEMVEVTEVGRAELGGTLEFAVDAPSGEYYTVRVVNGEQDAVDVRSGFGSETFDISLDNYQVGTYVVVVTNESGDEREVYAAEPFVVQGYDVTQNVPDSVDSDGTFTVDVTISPRDDPPAFESVNVAVGDDSTRIVAEADRVNETTYRATVDAGQFEDGEYTVVSGVRGDLAFDDTAREYYGISDSTTVRVGSDSGTATATATDSGGSGGDSGTGSTTGTATTEAPTSNATATASDTTATATTDTPGSETTTPGPTVGPTTTAPPATTSPTDGDTATPSSDDESGGDGDDSGDSGGSTETTGALVHPLGLALLVAVGLVALRRREP
ncbi:hypothetical protein [Halobaculum magnesiiphilum]|uniref:Uncharacterized protein n=1 Tax=Halobaculum magnesiiphilum TaxID=1017351 RepID=A0A8T8WF23_9EURY|nr:hypothetical protein [Halobaculum magnesiiphilum]QZP38457.1 hypothetical protein K6T50_04765 [Halobaculum magnesiiphilum]